MQKRNIKSQYSDIHKTQSHIFQSSNIINVQLIVSAVVYTDGFPQVSTVALDREGKYS